MPKYSDYREWENHRQELLDAQVEQHKKGFATYETIPLLPPEGIVKWTEEYYSKGDS